MYTPMIPPTETPAPAAPSLREAERSDGERSGGAAGARAPIPTPDRFPGPAPAKATRRHFTIAQKRDTLRRAEACAGKSELGALLRREGIYSSHLALWRKQIDALEEKALAPKKRGPKPEPLRRQNDQLMRENERLKKKLAQARGLIDLQKKVFRLLDDEGEPSGND